MSQEFCPGLSENLETWHFWGVKLGYINSIVFLYPTPACVQKTYMYVAEVWSSLKTRHFSPVLTRLWFWLKRVPSTASTPAWWMSGGGFTTFGIKYHRSNSRSSFHVVVTLNNASYQATAAAVWQVRFVTRVTSDHFSVTFLTHVSH